VDFLVTPPDATEWRLDPADFAAALTERWPGAEVRENGEEDPIYALDFTLRDGGTRVDGSFARKGQMLGLDGALEETMPVAVWFRGLVDPRQPLLFYDPALNGQVELTAEVSAEDAVRAYRDDAA
jgi:hypothetical protein